MANYRNDHKRERDNYQKTAECTPAILPPKLGDSIVQ
jgi:hypothetical protein